MPLLPSAPELDRVRVEELLPWHLRAALPDLLPLWGIHRPDRWPKHPALRKFLVGTAVQVLQARASRRGDSETTALRKACLELGLNYATTRSGLGRQKVAYRRANECQQQPGAICPQTAKNAG